jgi:PAS domain-containing protein/DNA-binding CsgD family transcriptional regulator
MADPIGRIIPSIQDAALEPRLWTAVLQSLSEEMGAIGAAYIVRNTRTGRVEWANFLGPSLEFRSDYITHFAAKDPFIELFTGHEGIWMRLSERLSAPELRRNEWYHDFVLKCGVGDIIAAQITSTGSHTAVLGIHEGIGEKPICTSGQGHLNQLLAPLGRAAETQLRLQELGWKSAVAARAFDQVSTGVIVVDADGSVIEMNGLAERVVRRGDGLTIRHGALGAVRLFEAAKLEAAIASATRPGAAAASSRILIGRRGSKRDYILTVSSLGVKLGFYSDPMALIIVVDPEARCPKADDLSAYFGLSFAESRLAIQLMSGKQLGAMAAESGTSTATLRTQLRSILKKVKVERQADLFLVLARVPSSPDGDGDGPAEPAALSP